MSVHHTLLAVRTGQLPAVKRALARGELDRNLRDPYGATCLHLAARSGNLNLVMLLVEEAGHSTIATAHNGALASHDAAAAGHQSCLDYLLRWGCPDQARDHNGATVLHLSARFGHLSVLRYLVEVRGLNIRDKDKKGVSVLHYAAAKGDLACLMYILTTVPDMVNERTEGGATPAYFAVQNSHLSCLQHLVTASGANVHLRANDGMQPIHAAAQTGQLHCLIWLVHDQGVLPMERDNDGATPLHFAASRGHAGVMRWLLDNGALCEKDHLGGTPLHDAAEHGQLECAKILVEHGCDVNSEDKDFLVASDLAKKCGHLLVAKFLRSIEKRTGKAKGKGGSGHTPSDHEVGVYVKRSMPSPTYTSSSLSSSVQSDHGSLSSLGTIEREFVDRRGRYKVMDSPEPTPDPQYIQIYEKLTETDVGPTGFQAINGFRATCRSVTSPEGRGSQDATDEGLSGPKNVTEVCSRGTQTECLEPKLEDAAKNRAENGESAGDPDHEGATTTLPVVSPQRSFRRQRATEPSVMSSSRREAWIDISHAAVADKRSSLLKLSPEKKALRFSTTVMVEEIAQQEQGEEDPGPVSPMKRNVHLIPLNTSSETRLQSPPLIESSDLDGIPSPPSITSSPPLYLQTVTPSRPSAIVVPPPPMMASLPTSLQIRGNNLDKSREVSSRLSYITSAIPTPPSPRPPPELTNGLSQHSPTTGLSRQLTPSVPSRLSFTTSAIPTPPSPPKLTNALQHSPTTGLSLQLSPSVPSPPSPSDLAGVVLKPSSQNSRPSSSNSSTGGKPSNFGADLIAEIQAGAQLRQTRQNQSMFLGISKDPLPRSPSPVNDRGPKVFYATDYMDTIPMVDESGAELPDWRRRFLAKKEADRANQRAAVEYRQQTQQRAEEKKYRDMPPWKVELLRKKEANFRDPIKLV